MKKKFTSFKEIDNQLEILKLEREIQLRKMSVGIENITEAVTPGNLVKNSVMNIASTIQSSSGFKSAIITLLTRFVIKKIRKK